MARVARARARARPSSSSSSMRSMTRESSWNARARYVARVRRPTSARASKDGDGDARETPRTTTRAELDLDERVNAFAKKTATTFAPNAKKNPAYKGSVLYTIFEVQAYAAIAIGGLLAFNVVAPSDEPSIARLMGMWSVWMFTVPSLRARDCDKKEKDALNLLFVAIPLVNVLIPFVWKSFAGVFSADVLLMAAVYAQKGVFAGAEGDAPAAEVSEE